MGRNGKSFWEWIWNRTTAETKAHFKVGEKIKIYTRPFKREGFEGIAELIEFVGHDCYEGLLVERWKVRFDNEVPVYERIIFKDTSSLLSGRTNMPNELSEVLRDISGKEPTETNGGADIEYELAFKYPTSMILFNPRTGIDWNSSETYNLKGMKVLVHSDQQANWVNKTNGVPVKAVKVEPTVKIVEIAESTKDKTKSEVRPGDFTVNY